VLFDAFCAGPGTPCGPLGVEGTVKQTILSNTVYTVTLGVDANADNIFVDASTFVSALVDPMFTIDSSFTTPGYTVELSDGIGNQFTVTPEPVG
jgi:hypothetical protein